MDSLDTTTQDKYRIEVQVRSAHLADQSEEGHYVFAYTITLANLGEVAAQLISRHWIITDANGEIQEVRGMGVVGMQPTLQPGQQFEYTSGCVLTTPMGAMRGSYRMSAADGSEFDAKIPEFLLKAPYSGPPRVLH